MKQRVESIQFFTNGAKVTPPEFSLTTATQGPTYRSDMSTAQHETGSLFTAEEQKRFDASLADILKHYPDDRKEAAMLPALRLVQSIKGWLPPAGMLLVAQRLGTTPARAYEVATFYVMYHTEKPGKYVVDVCTNLSCALRGAEDMLAYLENKLGLKAGEANAKFTLRETECLASCGTAPCLQINEDHHESLTPAKLDALFGRLT